MNTEPTSIRPNRDAGFTPSTAQPALRAAIRGAMRLASLALKDQRGQTLPFVAMAMLGLLGIAGLVTDAGRAYLVRAQLQNAANAAALAGAGSVYEAQSQSVNTTTEANLYNAGTGDKNAYPGLTVTTTVATKCLNSLMAPGTTCNGSSFANAVQVTNSATVPTFLMRLFGVPTLTVRAQATASIAGLANQWNIAVIVDATGSMATTDTNCGGITQFQCALDGVQTMLAATNPCRATTCTPANANARVALFSYPNIMTSPTNYLPIVQSCSTMSYSGPGLPYNVMTLPKENATSYAPIAYQEANGSYTWAASYEMTWGASDADANGYVSDYYQPSNKTTGGLNPNSSLIQAIGYGGSGSNSKAPCLPIAPSGLAINGAVGTGNNQSIVNTVAVGEGITNYAPVIYAAQASLVAEQALHPGSQNAIILLSDGTANAQWIYFPQGSLWQWPSTNASFPSTLAPGSVGYDTLNSTPNKNAYVASGLSSPNQEATGAISGLYPDFFDECQQAIVAGQRATAAGTTVFAVAYGSATGSSSGCGSGGPHAQDYNDVTLVSTGNNASYTLSSLTPCVAMENIATSLQTFYSDYQQSGSGSTCQDSSHPEVQLNDIFTAISSTFTTPRLIPNNAT